MANEILYQCSNCDKAKQTCAAYEKTLLPRREGMKKKKERNDYWLVMAVIMAIFIPISYYYCGLAGAITPVAGAATYGYLYYRGL